MEPDRERSPHADQNVAPVEISLAKRCVLSVPHISAPSSSKHCVGSFVAGVDIRLLEESEEFFHNTSFETLMFTDRSVDVAQQGYVTIFRTNPLRKKTPSRFHLRVIGDMLMENSFHCLDQISFENISRAGISMCWEYREKKLYFHIFVKPEIIQDSIYQCDLQRSTALYPGRYGSGEVSNIQIMNSIMCLAYEQYADEMSISNLVVLNNGGPKTREHFDTFFEAVKNARKTPPRYDLNLSELTSTLRGYQTSAVHFMIDRELNPAVNCPQLMKSLKIREGLFFVPVAGAFCRSIDDIVPLATVGGILADEMGLGKTVELLALILTLTRDNKDMIRPTTSIRAALDQNFSETIAETVDFLISSVVAATEGVTGLNAIRKLDSVKNTERVRNVVFNLDTYVNRRGIGSDSIVRCTDCGISCLKNKMHFKDQYLLDGHVFSCPECIAKKPLLPIDGTLIVVPQAILHQWYEEIRRHVRDTIVIDVYNGVATDGYKHPIYLSKCQIVLCSYETMSREFDFVEPRDMSTRLRKRTYALSKTVTSPLLAVDWWRICLDESQLVESSVSRVSEMCRRLSSRARWCVTGTPLIHSVNDLYYLTSFLNLYPLTVASLWKQTMYNPWCAGNEGALVDLMKQIFWRNSKEDVHNQLGLPGTSYEVEVVNFSPLEERLYSERIRESRNKIRISMDLASLDQGILLSLLPAYQIHQIMNVLYSLRLSVVTGDSHLISEKKKKESKESADASKKKKPLPFTPEALYRRLFKKNRIELEERTREVVGHLNGLAGLEVLFGGKFYASYQKVFELRQETEALNRHLGLNAATKVSVVMDDDDEDEQKKICLPMKIDTIQLYHAYTNCFNLIKERGLKLDQQKLEVLERNSDSLRNRFMSRDYSAMMKELKNWTAIEAIWTKKDPFELSLEWLITALSHSGQTPEGRMTFFTGVSELKTITNMFSRKGTTSFISRTFDIIKHRLIAQDTAFEELREMMLQLVDGLASANEKNLYMGSEANTIMKEIVECEHSAALVGRSKEEEKVDEKQKKDDLMALCGKNVRTNAELSTAAKAIGAAYYRNHLCLSCRVLSFMDDVEEKFYLVEPDGGPWMKVCELAVAGTRSTSLHQEMEKGCQEIRKWFVMCQKTISDARKVLSHTQEVVSRHRELKMAKSRIEDGMMLMHPTFGERSQTLIIAKPVEKEDQLRMVGVIKTFRAAVQQATERREKCKTRIKYLHTLNEDESKEDSSSRDCPVCYSDMKGDWYVFPCAHVICVNCLNQLKKHEAIALAQTRRLLCVTCRQGAPLDTISLVQCRPPSRPSSPGTSLVSGTGLNLTVKFNAVMAKMKMLLRADPTNKILLFSSMLPALDCLAKVLVAAEIPFRRLTSKDPSSCLAAFRNDFEVRVLMLSLSSGANGLNLTQANHVMFLEPITDTSVISQAIGRMARMGQHRAMTVHHFVIKGSVEEEIHRVVSGGSNEEGWTVKTLYEVLGL